MTRFSASQEARAIAYQILSDTYSELWFDAEGDYSNLTERQRERIKAEYGKIIDRFKPKRNR